MSKKLLIAIMFGAVTFGTTGAISGAALAASDADLRKKCETQKDADACFEVGFRDLKKGNQPSRQMAKREFYLACAHQKKKANCSKDEARLTAKNYRDLQGRVPANAPSAAAPASAAGKKKVIKAPKISPSNSSLSSSGHSPHSNTYQTRGYVPPPSYAPPDADEPDYDPPTPVPVEPTPIPHSSFSP